MTEPIRIPTAADAAAILSAALGKTAQHLERFPTGSAHYVYDVVTTDGEPLVIRLGRSDAGPMFAGALYWHGQLKPRGIPLPELYYGRAEDPTFPFPGLIMERLRGTDLGAVYPTLTREHKQMLAAQMVDIHARVGTLPPGRGYGYATAPDDAGLHSRWADVLDASLERSSGRIAAAGVFPLAAVNRVAEALRQHDAYFDAVAPRPFLDDTTTKNVIIHEGRLSGIVDVDFVIYGDPLYVVALTRMSLLMSGYDRDYTDAWAALLDLSGAQKRALRLYTALFCVDFMSEIGQAFNRDAPAPVDARAVARLNAILERLLTD